MRGRAEAETGRAVSRESFGKHAADILKDTGASWKKVLPTWSGEATRQAYSREREREKERKRGRDHESCSMLSMIVKVRATVLKAKLFDVFW